MSLKAAIYDPYLDTLGGGERYCLTVAETLLKQGYQVDLFWSGDKNILTKAQSRFNLDIANINIVNDIFLQSNNSIEINSDSESLSKSTSHHRLPRSFLNIIKDFYTKYNVTRQYDLIFYISDWSLPFLFSKNNLLHVQVPFATTPSIKTKILNYFKMFFINNIICNSIFTSRFATSQFGKKCVVVYPPVDTEQFLPSRQKENIILSVGRFDNILNSKKQDLLIESFKLLKNQPWKLILAGGSLVSPEKNSYLQHLKSISAGYPIEFYVNPAFSELKSIYEKSKIYWHAAGFEVDEKQHPENTEHFGMAPVEAMASGCVPIVVNKGGLNEIIENSVSGYLWNDTSELLAKTQKLITSPQLLETMSRDSINRSKLFSKSNFISNLNNLI